MGVKYLETYSKQVGALEEVNILDEIRKYRLQTQRAPTIVIDGENLLYCIVRSKKLSWLTGGYLHEFEKYLRNFISKLRNYNTKVVIFFDGANYMYNTETWINRRKERIANIHKNVFDKLEQEYRVEEIERNSHQLKLISGIWAVTFQVLDEKGCQVNKGVYDCDFEIAAYVNSNPCMGIIANDTDFIINCPCNIYRFSDNFETMKFIKRNREKLLNSLGIHEKMLPLFASLVGNDVVCEEISCHSTFDCWKNVTGMYKYLAKYIRTLNIRGDISDTELQKIASDLFNEPQKAKILRKSIESYNASQEKIDAILIERLRCKDAKWSAVLGKVYDNHRKSLGSPHIYEIVTLLTFQNTQSIEDFRKKDILPVNKILRPLRKKIYGILLHDKPGDHFVQEMVVDNCDVIKPCQVMATTPRVSHPGLIALWDENNNYEDSKWELLGDVMDKNPLEIKRIPPHLLVPALSVLFLKRNITLEDWETKALILSTVIVSYMSEPILTSIHLRRVKSRAVILFSILTNTHSLICLLLESLGNIVPLKQTLPTIYQDGNVFHLVYNAMNVGIKSSKILKLGYKDFFKSQITACENDFQQLLNFLYED